MDDEAYQELRFDFESARLRLRSSALIPPPPLPSARRLSFGLPHPPPPMTTRLRYNRQLSGLSLQGWLADAEEATSARAIKGGLKPEQAVAWELFTPIQRVLFVATISVAAAKSKKNRLISQLKKSVELRDQVLTNMQHKLDSLCEQISNIKEHSGTAIPVMSPTKCLQSNETIGCDQIRYVDRGCWLCDQHHDLSHGLVGHHDMKSSSGDEIMSYKSCLEHVVEHEERRMSDLSDMASSVTSAADIQLNSLAIEQDVYNLRRDCEEKDGTIKELASLLHQSETAGSKRIAELEEILRKKNSIIMRIKKDLEVMEQKVVHHTRLRRSSYSASSSGSDEAEFVDAVPQIPHMADNLLYDMDSSTSPESSDSERSSPQNRTHSLVAKSSEVSENPEITKTVHTLPQTFESSSTNQTSVPEKALIAMVEQPTSRQSKFQSVAPLKEITMNSRYLKSVSVKLQPVSRKLQPVSRKLQPVSTKSQTVSPRSQSATPLSPLSNTSPPMSSSSQPASPLSPLTRKSQPASFMKTPSTVQSSRSRELSASADSNMRQRRSLPQQKESKFATSLKRWT